MRSVTATSATAHAARPAAWSGAIGLDACAYLHYARHDPTSPLYGAQFAGLLADTAHLLGHDLTVFYSVGNLDLHTLNLVRSMREGLLSVVSVGRQVVVMPELFGPPAGYHWHQSPERQKFLAAGGKEGVMPRLKPDPLEQMIREIPGSYSALLEKSSPLKIADRALLFRWLAAAHAVAALGVNHE